MNIEFQFQGTGTEVIHFDVHVTGGEEAEGLFQDKKLTRIIVKNPNSNPVMIVFDQFEVISKLMVEHEHKPVLADPY